jgi:hypothetical protein
VVVEMTVAMLIAILQGCKPQARVVYPNMEIDEKIEVQKVTELDKGKYCLEKNRYQVVLR